MFLKEWSKLYQSVLAELEPEPVGISRKLGFRGESILDSGYFYAPYIPLLVSPVVIGNESKFLKLLVAKYKRNASVYLDFVPRRGILTRYGKKLLKEGAAFYSRISVKNFDVS